VKASCVMRRCGALQVTGRACEANVTTAKTTSCCVAMTTCSRSRYHTGYLANSVSTRFPTSTCRTPQLAWTSMYMYTAWAKNENPHHFHSSGVSNIAYRRKKQWFYFILIYTMSQNGTLFIFLITLSKINRF